MWSVGGCAGPCPRSRLLALFAAVLLALAVAPTAAPAATLNATTANLSSVFSSAQAGDTILLASGSYGTWSGGSKAGIVTLRPASGASVTMRVSFSGANNITIDGLTLPEVYLGGSTKNVAIVNATVTGPSVVDASTMKASNILFDNDTFYNIDACSTCYEGRLTVRGNNNTAPVGVRIANSRFGNGGGSDGVQIVGDAYGVEIGPGNEFAGIKQGSYAAHVDSIQLYGSKYTQIVGNYFHDNDTIIMAPDGGDHEYIANNVMVGSGYVPAVQLGSHDGTQFVHNTVENIDVHADAKSSSDPSRNVVVSNNIFVNGSTNATGSLCSACTVSYNLFTTSGNASGSNTVIGTPQFAGGTSPTTFAGYVLTAGSPGKTNASDGKDRGINADGAAPPPADTTAPDTSITSAPSGTTNDSTPTFGFTATESGTFQCKVDAGSWAACSSPYTTAALADGAHTFSVRATDGAGNTDATPATASFTIDTSAPNTPATAVWTPPAGATAGTPVTLDGSASGGDAPLTCTWSFENQDGTTVWETATGCKISKTFEIADTKYVKLTVADANGDTASSKQSFAVTTVTPADTTAPDTSITSGPSGLTRTTAPAFAFTATEAGSTFECKVDAGSWTACVSPYTTAALADGAHTFSVRATDGAGNTDASPATRSFTVDTTAPGTTITSGPSGTTTSATSTFAFTSDDPGATFQCKVDAGSWATCTSPFTTAALADGAHTVSVRARDAAGNTDATPASRSFTVSLPAADTTPPDTAFTGGPSGPTSSPTPTFTFSSTESGSTFECRVDLGTWAACTSPWTTPALADGAHSVAVRAKDAAGNIDASATSRAFSVDATAPKTTIGSGPAASSTDTSPSFAFTADDTAARFECSLDDVAWETCTSPYKPRSLALGAHVLRVRAIDALGNVESPGTSWSWTIVSPSTSTGSGSTGSGSTGGGNGKGNGKPMATTTDATVAGFTTTLEDPVATISTTAPKRLNLRAPKTVVVRKGAFKMSCGLRCIVKVTANVKDRKVLIGRGTGKKVALNATGRRAVRRAGKAGVKATISAVASTASATSASRLRQG